jgi:hypothetical protein
VPALQALNNLSSFGFQKNPRLRSGKPTSVS